MGARFCPPDPEFAVEFQELYDKQSVGYDGKFSPGSSGHLNAEQCNRPDPHLVRTHWYERGSTFPEGESFCGLAWALDLMRTYWQALEKHGIPVIGDCVSTIAFRTTATDSKG